MKFSEKWLRTFVNPPLSATELAEALTMAGLEVESIEPVAPFFENVVVAEILSIEKHPSADHLSVCQVNAIQVNAGQVSAGLPENREPLQIVCGAPNVCARIKVPCALPGAQLPGMTIRPVEIRGFKSAGMLCSPQELGLQADTDGLLLLPAEAPVGANFRDYYELDDRVFTLKLTPNRGDCLGLKGIAREVAAITGEKLSPLAIETIEPVTSQIADSLSIKVDAPSACPLYCGRVIRNVALNVSTPSWMVRRLERSGMRAINAIVDVTNYVMLETGQPLHAFDLSRISGGLEGEGSIHVRYAESGEKIQLLNGENLLLQPGMLLIADDIQPLALAGIMGGSESGVKPGTTDIFLESAFFNPAVIAGKSFILGFSSDSAHRFERGVDFAATRDVMERATRLILDICGGGAGPVSEIMSELPRRDPICLRAERTRRILGVDLGEARIAEILQRLQFKFKSADGVFPDGVFHVTPPTYRFDLAIEEDLIEELARVHGYNHIEGTLPVAGLGMLPDPEAVRLPSRLRQVLVGRDYQEVINYGFVDASWEFELADNRMPAGLKNPLSSQMSVMRSSLLGGLLANLRLNLSHKQTRVRLFEIGCCFKKGEDSDGNVYVQKEKLAGLCYGEAMGEQWGIPAREVDFYDVKADIEALFWPSAIRAEPAPHPALHPGKSACIYLGERVAAYLGELHPRWQKNFDLPKPPVLFELALDVLMARTLPQAAEISKYPPIRRDIAVVVAENVEVQTMLDAMQTVKSSIVSEISLFDVYRGKGVEHSKKSLAFRILLQDTQKTLTDAEADREVASLRNILKERFDATLRS
jgi:phenylalanyl-tRNA synthetase beta chain